MLYCSWNFSVFRYAMGQTLEGYGLGKWDRKENKLHLIKKQNGLIDNLEAV